MARILIQVQARYPINRQRVKEVVLKTLSQRGVSNPGKTEVGINFINDQQMINLNQTFRGKKKTTDVLSFPLTETSRKLKKAAAEFVPPPDDFCLGDIVISYPQAKRQAQQRKLLVDDEIDLLVQHGLLHLLGIHHK